jgi:WhiB family redox-sensing transcriptional regulator
MTSVTSGERASPVAEMTAAAAMSDSRSWRNLAACAGHDLRLFFADSGARHEQAIALRICYSCPVRDECLEEALSGPERFGIWGGMTERQRGRLLVHRGQYSS